MWRTKEGMQGKERTLIMSKRNANSGGSGCLGFFVFVIFIAFAMTIYSYFWIPAIPIMIYLAKSKKFAEKRARNVTICAAILITSLITFGYLNAPTKLSGIEVTWGNTEATVGDTIELEVAAIPSDAKLKDVEMPKSDLVDFKFRDGKAVVTFENPGETEIWFTAGKDIKSEKKKFTVISKEEKAQREAAELAEKQAQEEAEKQAELQAQQEAALAEQERIAQEQAAQQSQEDPIVYVTNTGAKYHSAGCRTLKSKIEKHLSEVRGYYEPCGICNPPQ